MAIQIGPYALTSQVLLAPMAGTSDRPFRMLCKAQGAALTTSEMVVIQTHLLKTNKSKYRLDFKGESAPISIQIAGSGADELAISAQKAVEFGADIIDINMGCPAKKVCNKAAGSALMQDEILVKDILNTVVNSVDVPVTLKMRTGWNRANKNAPIIAQIAQDAGIQMLSVHGRTKADKYNGEAEYATIAEVVTQVSIPVIANGDITSAEKAKRVLSDTGVSGIMLGRATQGNPWIIAEIDHYLKTNEYAKTPSFELKKQTALNHIQQIHEFYGEGLGVRIARKHILWYLQHFENKPQTCWTKISKINTSEQQYQQFKNCLNELD
ncbi:tRNA dihydrouridine synthase B [Bathymodiolus heckerae thiotrophic gill symbiont]|uniref:tRNA dihydrouridine synthase DusB n=1 Tax=Bathymodiolus heckerae thiotrophic gill symbiont TaxID=1052212 RepID=UPI0010BAC438|nr:tRNA dihydrouridine synthase DusB [Bathymodiolus heckerae thiotrophic gill symbiont]SMN13882.1 tRNA dihydrouridine synthase B [Bathymodiolus heckerae thiotrophic gill symbiont]SMN16630.1 tRNA dihydrouridine synthase B [uncultured Candidatus Thioglobus sp.]